MAYHIKEIPESIRYCRGCYFCHTIHSVENPVAYEISRIMFGGNDNDPDSVYCCTDCLTTILNKGGVDIERI